MLQQYHPTVSVIIPAYNVAAYVADTLRSVFAQTRDDYEVVVVNDGSTDATERAIEPFRHRLTYIRQRNAGPSAARNHGLGHARGRFVALLDGDDLWEPAYLEKLVGKLEADASLDLVYPNARLFGDPHFEGKLFQDLFPSSEPVTFEKVLVRECNVTIAALFRREWVARVGGFDVELRGVEDFDLWLRMLKGGARFAFTTEPLLRYRKRASSLSSDDVKLARGEIRVYEKLLADARVTPRERELIGEMIRKNEAKMSLALSKQLIAARDFAAASEHLRRAAAYYKSWKLRAASSAFRVAPGLLARFLNFRDSLEAKHKA
jgi:glycosyltransferase involved in cell wall biosynthesis